MRTLLNQAAQQTPTPYITKLLTAFPKKDDEMFAEPHPHPVAILPTVSGNEDWLAPLSEREGTVLRLLSAGHSNKSIAKELGLSPNTVKWYLKGLFVKLGADGRLQAVNRAKDLGFL